MPDRKDATSLTHRRVAGGTVPALVICVLLASVSPAGLAQAGNILSQRGAAPAPVSASMTANLLAQQQAAAVALQSQNELAKISTALLAVQTAQTAARNAAAAAPSTVQNGLQNGGLVPDSGLAAAGVANPVQDWTNAATPTQTTAGGQTTVTINQTAAQAILSWNSFNVGKTTTVQFNQQQSTWVALNRIAASGVPSQILGSIKAPGQVYLINPNGIIFGGASQVNTGALVASSAAISDSQFTTSGIYSTLSGLTYAPSFTTAGGAITVQAGAQITTAAPSAVTTGGGFVLLMGTSVSNAGAITTPSGQTELAAGDNFLLRPGYSTSSNQASTTSGNEIAVQLDKKGSSLTGGSGTVSNTGVITADTGDITLAGETVTQDGVLLSTTSLAVRGTIHLLTSASDKYSAVTLGGNSLTLIAPDLSSTATALDSQRAALIADSAAENQVRYLQTNANFDDLSQLPDQQEDSRIEIVSGNTVEFQNGSQTVAQGGQVAVSAVNRIQTDTGALVDVAGTYGVSLPVSANDIAVNIQNFEQRDNPQNRQTQNLTNGTVYVDDRDLSVVPAGTGGYATARDYTDGGLLEVSGYVATTGHTIGEWTALGGTITFSTGTKGAVVAQSGSIFNIDGGSIQYQPGLVDQSYVLGENGQIYNINNAPAYLTYAGVYNGFVDNHAAWGVSQTYGNVLADPAAINEPGYTEGRDAGTLTLNAPTTLFDGTIEAGVVNGPAQTSAAPSGVTDPYTLAQNVTAESGSLVIGALGNGYLLPGTTNVTFSGTGTADSIVDGLGVASKIAGDLAGTSSFNAGTITAAALGGLDVLTNGKIGVTAPLTFAAGAAVSLFGSAVTIAADLIDPSGTVSAGNYADIGGSQQVLAQKDKTGSVILGESAEINTSGLWTNLALDPDGPNFSAFSNGGAVSLVSATNINLETGSLIDASAGAVLAQTGARNGGAGGAITLDLVNTTGGVKIGDLRLDGQLQSTGFNAGGVLSLDAPNIVIGNVPVSANPAVVTLNPGFFTAGFSAYDLSGKTTIAPDTNIDVVEPTEQFTTASETVPTGGATAAGAVLVLQPVYVANPQLTSITQRPGGSFSLTSQTLDLGAGSSITVDPKQSITLAGAGQMTIDGDLTAPGGSVNITDALQPGSLIPFTTYAGGQVLSIWVGASSRISTAGIAFTASNPAGGGIALAPAGGAINLTGNDAVIIVQTGAVLDAAGAAATEHPVTQSNPDPALGQTAAGAPVINLTGAGGTIALQSANGLFLDGTMVAPGGGPAAAGGTLSLDLTSDDLLNGNDVPDAPRIITISQTGSGPALPANLQPGKGNAALVRGSAAISVAQIDAGGFGTLSFSALDAFEFAGNVTLSAAQSITLSQGVFTDNSKSGAVVVAAPYVLLGGVVTQFLNVNGADVSLQSVSGYSPTNSTGTFTVDAAMIDLQNAVAFGGIETRTSNSGPKQSNLEGFGTVDLDSGGAMRFLTSALNGAATPPPTTLISTGNINLAASEIYATGSPTNSAAAAGVVFAGYTPKTTGNYGSFAPNKVLTISRASGAAPAVPLDIGGSMTFLGATIKDSGVVWQPLGAIDFGSIGQDIGGGVTGAGDPRAVVEFLPGSVTSVSAAGLTIPYGGTTDGITYTVDGNAVASAGTAGFGLANVQNGVSPGTITVAASTVSVAAGAVLDLSGGGNLTGAGFISGEIGSTNALTAPLLQAHAGGGVTQPSLGTDPVYAIIAGPQPQVAPTQVFTQTGATASTPAIGAQIIVPAGVPGLPAGRYTLLPAAYALNPGGYRVEFDGAASLAAAPVLTLPNGSYAVAGDTGIIDTNVQSSLPVNLTITPAATVQTYAEYDTQSYSQYLQASAALVGAVRPALPIDAGTLFLYFPALDVASLTDAGAASFAAASGGNPGTLQISGAPTGATQAPNFVIYGNTAPTPAHGVVALSAATIDAFNASTLEIGAANLGFDANTNGITLESGATLTAARVILTALNGGITLQNGSEINTLGRGSLFVDSNTNGPYFDNGASVLDVGNGYLTYTDAGGSEDAEYGPISIDDGATIYTDGSIAFSTGAAVNIGVGANYGGAYLDLAVPEINVGDPTSLGAAAAPGLTLTQAVLQQLTAGVPAAGVPAAQILVLSASDSLNFFGTTGLDLSGGNVQLVINSPAIYGYGTAGDVATVQASTIVWNGDLVSNPTFTGSNPPGGVVANGPGTGAGTLDFDANTIVFGYSNLDRPTRDIPLDRITLGFSKVNLNAATEITANNQGSLAVYQSQGQYGASGSGGVLNLNTPLLTGEDEATMSFTAGGALNVSLPTGSSIATALPANNAGAEIDLNAGSVTIASAVILPSGKLDIQSSGNIAFGAGSTVNLAGDAGTVLGQTTDGAGGDLIAESEAGNITQAAGSVINVAAAGNHAGAVTLTAMAPGAGQVALDGRLTGGAPAAYNSGSFSVRAQGVGDFASLNAALDTGGFFDARSFEIAQGDLTIGDGIQAHTVSVSLDAGSLTVTGTIDASGGPAGNIALAAADNLTLASSAVLAAQGTVLQTDSYGQPIAAANAPQVSLTASAGELTLAQGATIDLASADNVARGDLELNVPRLGAGDADISTATGLNITGAATIAVNAFATYNGVATTAGADGAPDALITQAYLDQINTADTLPFMAAAANNADLAARLRGLTSGHDGILHFRPGVEIVSETPDGDLTVQGDIDLSGFRYGPGVNPAIYGSGEPGVLEIRAGGNLNVFGSITDGFYQPINDAGTTYASGWVLYAGQEPYNQTIVVPAAVTLEAGSSLGVDETVNYAVPIYGGTFESGAVAPVALTLAGNQKTTVAFVATSAIMVNGQVIYAQGDVVPAGTLLPNNAVIAAGGEFPFQLNVRGVVWPANTPFTITSNNNDNGVGTVVLNKNLTLLPGAIIPGDSYIDLPNGAASVSTRVAAAGTQGQLYPLAQLLPAGDLSWSIQLVAGANTAAAAPDEVQAASSLAAAADAGGITLADTHYGQVEGFPVPAFSVVRTGTGGLSLAAGGGITEASDYGVYTAGDESAPILDSAGGNPYDLPQGLQGGQNTLLGPAFAKQAALVANYQANYPTDGGNVLIAAQGALDGFISTIFAPNNDFGIVLTDTDAIGSWLWRQGAAGQAGAWWVEFGALEIPPAQLGPFGSPGTQMDGFQGIGTLGGGNLTVDAGGGAAGLNLAVASTGRVLADGTLVQTGGGNLTSNIGGAVNFVTGNAGTADAGGVIADLRGNTAVDAGSIGTIIPNYENGNTPADDPRAIPALQTELALVNAGIDLAPGDGTVTVDTRGDLVIDHVDDAGTVSNQVNTTPIDYTTDGKTYQAASGGTTIFTLWTAGTGVTLNSAGGGITPLQAQGSAGQNASGAGLYPPSLSVVAQNGNIDFTGGNVELAPAADGTLDLLAAGSIYGSAAGGGTDVAISGADPSLEATPFNPLISVVNVRNDNPIYTNSNLQEGLTTIGFGPDTPAASLHDAAQAPALVLAGTDIVGLTIGQVNQISSGGAGSLGYVAALPFDVAAGRDIVASGSPSAPSVFLNLDPDNVTSVTAGRDILESSLNIAGPGTMLVQAGRNVYQANQGVLDSVGPLYDINPDNRDGGAGITVIAGTGATGPDYAAFANLYLNPDSTLKLQDASAIIAENDALLLSYLQANDGYTGSAAGAYARFAQLPAAQQQVFLLDVYFAMLNQSGLEFNQPDSVRYKSYALGRDAIATLFPSKTSAGQPIAYNGDITLFGGSGIHTDFGGAIQTLTPGGETIIGVEGASPPGSAGFITQGTGDIDIYALDSVLLGESRVLTTFGGNILIWSAGGNINAGRGDKTSIDYTPLQRVYDDYGNVALSPNVPSTGAGIGTLNPIPQVAPGDINLVAPLGTVDAGSAGIRVSGNLNIAALHVLNAANIQVQGSSAGVPTAPAVDVGALTTAGNAAGSGVAAAENAGKTGAANALPSIWIVEILGYGGDGSAPPPPDKRKAKPQISQAFGPAGLPAG
jgi:filamentous hemagglutinin family protein